MFFSEMVSGGISEDDSEIVTGAVSEVIGCEHPARNANVHKTAIFLVFSELPPLNHFVI